MTPLHDFPDIVDVELIYTGDGVWTYDTHTDAAAAYLRTITNRSTIDSRDIDELTAQLEAHGFRVTS